MLELILAKSISAYHYRCQMGLEILLFLPEPKIAMALHQVCSGLPPQICEPTDTQCIFQKNLDQHKCYDKARYETLLTQG